MTTHLFDSLESRRLLSVLIKHGDILVRGTEGDDTIIFRHTSPAGTFTISDGRTVSKPISPARLTRVRVEGGGGNDSISLEGVGFMARTRIVLKGGRGDDTIHGGMTNDVILGGSGNDQLFGSFGDDLLRGDQGQDVLHGSSGADMLRGGDGDDALFGEADGDTLIGDGGADLFDGGDGDGQGHDVADYHLRTTNLTIRVDNAGGDGAAGENDKVLPSIEVILGGSGDDHIESLAAGQRTIHGNQGNDTIITGGGVAYGDEGNDQLIAHSAGQIGINLEGGLGNDTLSATGSGGVGLYGREGDDNLAGGDGADGLDGGEGNNSLSGGGGNDTLTAGAGRDIFAGGDGIDAINYSRRTVDLKITLDGNADDGAANEGDNVMADIENVLSGSGNDLIVGNDANNELSGGSGTDTIHGGPGDDTLRDGLVCVGDARSRRACKNEPLFADQLFGEDGNDSIYGLRGADSLFGGEGNDYLYAITPSDGTSQTLDGGAGVDEAHIDAGMDRVSNVEKVFDSAGQPVP